MNINKKLIGGIAGLVCVVLCVVLMLTQCNGGSEHPVETTGATTAATTLPTEASTAPTVETTAPTAETTQPTEAVTEPSVSTDPTETTAVTEPATEPSGPVHGEYKAGSTMGGSMSGNSGTTDSDTETTEPTEPEIQVAEPGTASNAYTEYISKVPSDIKTVKIPSNQPICYHFYNVGGKQLTVADPDAYIVYNGSTIEPVDGIVSVVLEQGDASAPTAVQIGSKASADKAFTLSVLEPSGSVSNPQVLESIDEIKVSLAEGDEDGRFYTWTADGSGTVSLHSAAGSNCDIILTNGETTVSLRENGVIDEVTGTASVQLDVQEGDEVTIQIVAVPENGVYPEAEITVNGTFADGAGTGSNPLEAYDIPVITELIPAGAELHYNVYGVAGMVLTIEDPDAYVTYNGVTYGANESGILTLRLEDGMPRQPVALVFGNGGQTDESYTVNFTHPVGSYSNPEVIESLEEIVTSLAEGDTDGYYYNWTADEEGTLSLWVNSVTPENVQYDVMLSSTGSSSYPVLSESEDGMVSLDVVPGDVVTIQVTVLPDENMNVPAADISLSGMVTAPAGTESNPIWITENESQVTVPANATVYYQGYFGGTNMTVSGETGFSVLYNETVTADDSGVVSMDVADTNRLPVIFAIQSGDTEQTYNVTFTSPLGSLDNPEEHYSGQSVATISEGDTDGYYYKFTAFGSGMLTVTMDAESGWQYFINNMTSSSYGDTHWSDDDPVVRSETVKVSDGDEIYINVSTYNPESPWSAPAGEVPFTVSFMSGTGTAEEPFMLTDTENQVTVPAGQTVYYQSYFGGMDMTVIGDSGFSVIYDGKTIADTEGVVSTPVTAAGRTPVIFAIENGDAEKTYDVNFTYPLGSMENPELLYGGESTAKITAGDMDGYYFKFTSFGSGMLTVTVETESGWQYVINNQTSYIYGDIHTSEDDPVVRSETVEVFEDDEIYINVTTYDPSNPWSAPEGEVTITLSFMSGKGTAEEPFVLSDTENELTVPAGETVYYQGYFGGMDMTVSGETGFSVIGNGETVADTNGKVTMNMVATGRNPVVFAIVNGEAEAVYDVAFTYPVGNMENPAELVMGENTATLSAADPDGYFVSWIATGDGTLTLTVNTEKSLNGWQYVVNNLTTYSYGENHTSADEEPVSTVTVEVSQGDEIQINLNTFDPNDVWNPPAGDVVIDAVFAPAE